MIRRIYFAVTALVLIAAVYSPRQVKAEQAYGRAWGNTYNTLDWERFYRHFPNRRLQLFQALLRPTDPATGNPGACYMWR